MNWRPSNRSCPDRGSSFLCVPRDGNPIRATSDLTNPAKHFGRAPRLSAEMDDPIDHRFVGVNPSQLDAVVTVEDNGAASAAYSLAQLLLLPLCFLHEVFQGVRHDGSFLPTGTLQPALPRRGNRTRSTRLVRHRTSDVLYFSFCLRFAA